MSELLDNEKTWTQRDFGLDRRLVKALSKLGYVYPTLVQSRCIPLVLHGKDVVVRARTGSGKTVAFALPVLQKILLAKGSDGSNSGSGGSGSSSGGSGSSSGSKKGAGEGIQALILVPTKELCKQIEKHVTDLIYYCRDVIRITALADDNTSMQAFRLKSRPEIVVATPAKLVQHVRSGSVDLSMCKTLVIDEADLVLSFGYAEDIHLIKQKMPKIFQGLLMSATLSPELEKFKRLTLHNPAILKLEEAESSGHLVQFYLSARENDKFLVLYVFLRLGLLQGKGLIFVNDVNKCYRLKLFLQQFGVQAAVLNAEIPLNSRVHILDEFNRGIFDYLIATDASLDDGEEEDGDQEEGDEEGAVAGAEDEDEEEEEEEEEEAEADEDEEDEEDEAEEAEALAEIEGEAPAPTAGKKRKAAEQGAQDGQYGVSRGIDFVGVSFVINFDFPKTTASYTHRVGRTARGGASGTALSFVTALEGAKGPELEVARRDAALLQEVRVSQPRLQASLGDSVLGAMGAVDDPAFADSTRSDEERRQPAPLLFDLKDVESFRYRVEDTLRAVTQSSVREFRGAELKREILNSAKLKAYFASNPGDLKVSLLFLSLWLSCSCVTHPAPYTY